MSDAAAPAPAPNPLLTTAIMAATMLTTLDATIANVALPHMMGEVSASADQITWVLTAYIVAQAIVTPLTGWMEARFGRKAVLAGASVGFVLASMFCGASGSLLEIVICRAIQGACAAPILPLSQAHMLDSVPPERHGRAMAVYGMGSLMGPILGPPLGGFLTEQLSWRWVFYINVPVGALAVFGIVVLMKGGQRSVRRAFDFVGFSLIVIFMASFQLLVDRGTGEDWFSSNEIWIEAVLAASALWLFITYSITTRHPFFDPRLFKDRVFAACCLISLFFYMLLSSTMAMTPALMQTLLGYPVQTAGLLMMPRGLGCFAGMMVVGRITNVVDARVLLGIGLVLLGFSEWQMSHFDLTMPQWPLVASALTQGAGMGFIAVVLSAAGFATLPAALRAEATTVFYIVRNIGQSAGISTMQTLLIRNEQTMHASLSAGLVPTDPVVGMAMGSLSAPGAEAKLRALDAEVNRQASMVAYLNDFRLLTVLIVLIMPLLLLMRVPNPPRGARP